MHNLARRQAASRTTNRRRRQHLSATHAIRTALSHDVDQIVALTAEFVASGALLPRTRDAIEASLGNYVVAIDQQGRVAGCALLTEYSPSLGEVGSVAIAPHQQGLGLGTLVVRAIEALARRRGLGELFAVTAAQGFFSSLGFESVALESYPEKLASYQAAGMDAPNSVQKRCFRKYLGG